MIYGNVENENTTYAVVACSVSGMEIFLTQAFERVPK